MGLLEGMAMNKPTSREYLMGAVVIFLCMLALGVTSKNSSEEVIQAAIVPEDCDYIGTPEDFKNMEPECRLELAEIE